MTRDDEKPIVHLKNLSRSRKHRLAVQRKEEAEEEIKQFTKGQDKDTGETDAT